MNAVRCIVFSGYLAEFRAEVPVVVVCESEVIVCESEYGIFGRVVLRQGGEYVCAVVVDW